MDNRPIKGNSTGKYNMDFIDWNNEWCAVYNTGYNLNGDADCILFDKRKVSNSWNVQ